MILPVIATLVSLNLRKTRTKDCTVMLKGRASHSVHVLLSSQFEFCGLSWWVESKSLVIVQPASFTLLIWVICTCSTLIPKTIIDVHYKESKQRGAKIYLTQTSDGKFASFPLPNICTISLGMLVPNSRNWHEKMATKFFML